MKPHEETVLRIVYQTKDRPGPFEKRIYLVTNVPDQESIVITIKGMVIEAPVAKIQVEPRKVKLGMIKKGFVKDLRFQISNEGSESLAITKIRNLEATELYFDGHKDGNLIINPKKSMIFMIPFRTETIGPFVKVIFFESNARNTTHGRYAIMLIGEVEVN